MTEDQKIKALEVAKKAAAKGREVLLNYFGQLSRVNRKQKAGLVTEADVESERVISEFLRQHFADMEILGEEEHFQSKGLDVQYSSSEKGVWIIDPLDGTTNYVHGFPVFCISIGLEFNHQLQVGVIDVPVLDRTYSAISGKGAYVNDQKMEVSRRSDLDDSLLATGFFSEDRESLGAQLKVFEKLIYQVRGVRRAGAAAFDLCMVAEGVFDAFWEQNLKPWDTAAGALLVKEAGGKVTDYSGNDFHPSKNQIIASNPYIFSELRKAVNEAIKG